MNRATNKPYTEYFLVASGDVALQTSNNLFTGGINLADGQLGVIHARSYGSNAYGDFISGGDTVADAPRIKIVQGTPTSSNYANVTGWHYEQQPFVATPEINANSIQRVSSKVFGVPTYSTLAVTLDNTPVSNQRYALNLKLRSVRKDTTYGGNVDQTSVDSVKESFTGVSSPLDYVLTEWGAKMNVVSKQFNVGDYVPNNQEWLAVGLDASGGAGTAIGALEVGDSVDVFVHQGTTYSITITKTYLQTLADWITNVSGITAASTIEPIDMSTAGAGTIDHLMVLGLDQELAQAFDERYATKVRIEAAVSGDDATISDAAYAVEDFGSGRLMKIWYDNRAFGQTGSTQLTGFADTLVLPPNYIDESKTYVVHTIDAYHEDVINNDHIHNQTRVHILMEATDDSGTATVADGITVSTADTTTLTSLNAVLGAWLLSNDPFEINGDSTAAQLFA